jgi:hypothetical protein
VVSGKENTTLKPSNGIIDAGNHLEDGPELVLVHELVGHAIPNLLSGAKPKGNAIEDENKVRKKLDKELRPTDEKHTE